MEGVFALIVGIFILAKYLKRSAQAETDAPPEATAPAPPAPPEATPPTPPEATPPAPPKATADAGRGAPPIREVSPRRRGQMAQTEKWRAAKARQDDAEQVHSVHMDACESRLESLRVLYDAGILDREEYAQRVARTKAKHEEAR